MDFTAEQLTTLKTLLAENQAATERKITVEVTNLERKISNAKQVEESRVIASLRQEIQTAEENVKTRVEEKIDKLGADLGAKIDKLETAVHDVMEDSANKETELRGRVTTLEKLQNLS